MKKSKLFTVLAIGCMTVFALTACGEKKDNANDNGSTVKPTETVKETDKKVEVNVKEFAKEIAEKRTDVSLVEMTEDYVSGILSVDLTKVSDYSVYVDASGAGVDEYGIFKANEGAGEEVQSMLESYLDMRLESWMDEYMPEEKPKVENAVVKNYGDYYVYVILSDSEQEAFYTAFEDASK